MTLPGEKPTLFFIFYIFFKRKGDLENKPVYF